MEVFQYRFVVGLYKEICNSSPPKVAIIFQGYIIKEDVSKGGSEPGDTRDGYYLGRYLAVHRNY